MVKLNKILIIIFEILVIKHKLEFLNFLKLQNVLKSLHPLNHCQNYVRNRYNTFNMQSHHISNERVTKINETHEDSIIIDMEIDNERNENTENEGIINEKPSGKNSSKYSNKEKSGEEFAKDSDENHDENSDEDSDENSDKVLSGESDDECFSEESNDPMKNLTKVKKSLMNP
ncbi:hypothetical protein RhiirA5_383154 [Rhizophagus irregularis]|uniref:Uncharacterized protein n=1 Tax=Rhizophagus irregularis TaxID=588596 RepID=A0A2N0NY51_9GLOM|nr:hypothetical protein RhiirA5_383154 [Rhizophagus irregularis]